MLTAVLREIFRTNLGVRRGEGVLVFSDRPSGREQLDERERDRRSRLEDIALLAEETARGFTDDVRFLTYPAGGRHGMEPPAKVWRMAFGERTAAMLEGEGLLRPLLRKRVSPELTSRAERIIKTNRRRAVDVVLALSNYSTSHTSFRDFLTRACGARYASMPLFDIEMFEGPMNVDWRILRRRTREVARALRTAETVSVRAPNGTNIEISRGRRRVHEDNGMLRKPGSFGNLPAGEAFFAPMEGTARGTLVVEWGPSGRLAEPIVLIVRDGHVSEIVGDDEYGDLLRARVHSRRDNGTIAEFGVGTNERATRADNILEAEKILGTVHVAIGDNSTFGGTVKTPFHHDFVLFRPTVLLTDRMGIQTMLMENGRFATETL